jgi:hypothetical protein
MQKRFGAVWLPVVLTIHQPGMLWAQGVPAPPRPRMNIVVVEGEAAIHNLRDKKPLNIVVVVRDGNRKPLAGAAVRFTAPANGPGGTFLNTGNTLTATSDKDGYAIARGLRANGTPGPYRIDVQATSGDQLATAAVSQFNMTVESARHSRSGKWIALVAVAGAAAAGGTVAATRGKSSPASSVVTPTPISISAGTGVAGPPR